MLHVGIDTKSIEYHYMSLQYFTNSGIVLS